MTKLVTDGNGNPIEALKPTTSQTLSVVDTGAVASTAISTPLVRLVATTAVHYSVTGTATTGDAYLPANTIELIRIDGSDTVSAIAPTGGSGTMYITELV